MSQTTPDPRSTPPARRRSVGVAVAVLAVVVGLVALLGTPASAQLGEPLDPDDTTTTTEGDATTTTAADGPATTATTVADEGPTTTEAARPEADDADADEADDDGGTSVAALLGVGLVAFLAGLALAGLPLLLALSRKKAAPAPAAAPPAPAAPTPVPGGPAIGAPPARDADRVRNQRVALAEALIDLRDKLPSEALSAEAAAALAAAGITEIRPDGQPFDPARHRAVHQVATDDPALHGTVASVERPGYADGEGIIRQPEVVVAVHGGAPS